MSEAPIHPRHFRIVVALDLSEYAEIVLEHALDQAARHEAPDLHFLAVEEHRGAHLDELKQRLAALVYQGLENYRGDKPDWRARLHARDGRADEEIAGLAAEVRADLVVMGRFGLHHRGRRLGSVASHVIEAAPCPVLVVGIGEHTAEPETCPACAELRAESDGERWFCEEHAAPDRVGVATTFLPMSTDFTGGGPMW